MSNPQKWLVELQRLLQKIQLHGIFCEAKKGWHYWEVSVEKQMYNFADQEFHEILEIVRPYTLLSELRLYSLYFLAKQSCLADLPGNFVECGTCRGGSAALLAAVIDRYTQRSRLLYAFDTFAGMPDPTEVDRHEGIPANLTGYGVGTLKATISEDLDVVCEQLKVRHLVKPIQGLFADTLPKYKLEIGEIAFLHADGDWYQSTMDIFNNLYENVIPNGLVQIDDYGHWEGCRQAIHDFEAKMEESFFLHTIDLTGVWFRKGEFLPLLFSPKSTNLMAQLTNLIEQFYQEPTNPAIRANLNKVYTQLNQLWLMLPPDQLEKAYGGNLCQAYQMLLNCGINAKSLNLQ